MLLSFRAANHRSLRDEQHLLLTPSYAADQPDDAPWEALTVAGIFGPNASGKSNVIDALHYMALMVLDSFGGGEPETGVQRFPFALDPAAREAPSAFAVDLLLDGVRHSYGFVVDDEEVVEEWMYFYPRAKRRRIFHRSDSGYQYGSGSSKSLKLVEDITEANVLFLSVGARSRQKSLWPVYSWFNGLSQNSPPRFDPFFRWDYRVPEALLQPGGLERLTSLLSAADTGIKRAEVVEESDEEYLARKARETRGSNPPPRNRRLMFRHRGVSGETALSISEQSEGTRTLLRLSVPAFEALDRGAALVIDELDSSLHPFLTAQLIRLFREPETNPRGAQLIFTSHDVSLLGRIQAEEVLQRDHIWFTEKDECGATELFPLSDFKPRKDENRERRYLAGRYGAVPLIDDALFAAALAARRDSGDAAEEP